MIANQQADATEQVSDCISVYPAKSARDVASVVDIHNGEYSQPLLRREVDWLVSLVGTRNACLLHGFMEMLFLVSLVRDDTNGTCDERVCGYVSASAALIECTPVEMVIHDVVVRPEFRRLGIGTYAVTRAEAHVLRACRSKLLSCGGVVKSRAFVNEYRDPAIRLFAGSGYVATSVVKRDDNLDYLLFNKEIAVWDDCD